MNIEDLKNKITLADCMDIMAGLPDKCIDLAIVDPPYGIEITKECMGGRRTVKPDKNKSWDDKPPTQEYFKELFRVSKNQIIWGGVIILSCHRADIFAYGIKVRRFTGAILLSASLLGLDMVELEFLRKILTKKIESTQPKSQLPFIAGCYKTMPNPAILFLTRIPAVGPLPVLVIWRNLILSQLKKMLIIIETASKG